jgi:hypothetical protein
MAEIFGYYFGGNQFSKAYDLIVVFIVIFPGKGSFQLILQLGKKVVDLRKNNMLLRKKDFTNLPMKGF